MKLRCILSTFVTLLSLACVRAADVAFFGIIKSQEFVQTNANSPAARPTNGFAFNAFVFANSNNVVTNATVKPSNTTPLRQLLPLDTNTLAAWRFEERFNTQSALDGAYPNGNIITPVRYTNTMFTVNDGTRAVTLNYSLLSLLGNPNTPQITNFAAAQAIDHTADFTLRFNSSGNTLVDLVQVIVTDAASNGIFASPAPFSPGALTGASNSVVIPGYTLPPGATLVGHLSFVRPAGLETNAYPGVLGVPAVLKDTEFSLVTRPAPPPPVLEVVSMLPFFQLRCTGESNRNYHVQATQDFTNWTDVLVTNAPSAIYTDTDSATLPHRFFRVHVGP
jgi:hypothetical protein